MRVKGRVGEVSAEEYAREVGEQVAATLTRALVADAHAGVLPSPDVFAGSVEALVMHVPDESPNELAELLGPFWSGARVREVLGIGTRQALDSRRRNGSILGVKTTDGDLFYPVCQFQRRTDGQVEVKPALVPMFRALREFDPWTVGVLLYTPAPELGGLTPLDWVRRGEDPNVLVSLARTVAREWSAGAA